MGLGRVLMMALMWLNEWKTVVFPYQPSYRSLLPPVALIHEMHGYIQFAMFTTHRLQFLTSLPAVLFPFSEWLRTRNNFAKVASLMSIEGEISPQNNTSLDQIILTWGDTCSQFQYNFTDEEQGYEQFNDKGPHSIALIPISFVKLHSSEHRLPIVS